MAAVSDFLPRRPGTLRWCLPAAHQAASEKSCYQWCSLGGSGGVHSLTSFAVALLITCTLDGNKKGLFSTTGT